MTSKKSKQPDPDKIRAAIRITGMLIAVLAVYALTSMFSYCIHWKADMSAVDPRNAAGSSGFSFGRFLIRDCFGLGSLAIPAVFVVAAEKLLVHRWRTSFVRTCIISLSAALVSSILAAYIDVLIPGPDFVLFGGGAGGHCGSIITSWLCTKTGVLVSGLLIAVGLVVFATICSPRFTHWLANPVFFKLKKKEPVETEETEETPANPEIQDIPQIEDEPVIPEDTGTPDPEFPAAETPESPENPDISATEMEIIADKGVETVISEPLPRIDNRVDMPYGLPNYKMPSLDLLDTYESGRHTISATELTRNKNKIIMTLKNYRIEISDIKAVVGPTVTLYKITPAPGVKISSIKTLQEDIAMSLNAKGVRVVPLQDSVGIEVANDTPSIVPLRGLLNDENFRNTKYDLPVAVGYTITQQVKIFDLANAPHLLVAGATQQGKSVCLNVIINSLLFAKHPSELKFVFIDPKMVEFTAYASLVKHYLAVLPDADDEETEMRNSIVKKAKDAERILRSLCIEMDERYELMAKASVNKLTLYNDKFKDRKLNPEKGHRYLPYLVVIVDEYADLTMTTGASPEAKSASRSITNSIIRLAQKGRAAGLHVILATQRPSVDVISGIIKSNFPMRIAFRTSSRIDSQTIIDAPGAEKLIGRGDMLFSAGIDNERIQCGLIEAKEVNRVTEYIGSQTKYGQRYNTPYYLPMPQDDNEGSGGGSSVDMGDLDERFEEAARLVVSTQKASTSYLQTRLAMGFAKASRVMSQLEEVGIVGPQDGSKLRQVLVSDQESLDQLLNSYRK